MKSSTFSLLLLSVICASFASPMENHSLIRHRRQVDFFGNTSKLIQELIENLNKAAKQAKDAVKQFKSGLLEQAKQCRDKFMQDLSNLQTRVTESINRLQENFINSESAIGECISSHKADAESIYSNASQHMADCTDSRIKDGSELINNLNNLCENGHDIATQALEEMRNCTKQNTGNIFAVGSCLGSVAMKTEIKGASFLMQSGLTIGRLNLFMSTLAASLEVCAGSSLVNAGIGTAKVLMDIGSCSTNSVLSNFGFNTASVTGNAGSSIDSLVSAVAPSISSSSESATAPLTSASDDAIKNIML